MNRRKYKKIRKKNSCYQSSTTAQPVYVTPHNLHSNDYAADVVLIYKSELDYISRCILDYPSIETGGQLFGYWTSEGVPIVLYAIGPGPNANHQSAFFNQDVDYLERVGRILIEQFGLQHMGEWHSHHQLGLARPSGHDGSTIYNNVVRHGLERFLLCIGNCTNTTSTLNAFNFHKSSPRYVESEWEVFNMASPFRTIIDDKLRNILCHPTKTEPSMVNMKIRRMSSGFDATSNQSNKPTYNREYWLSRKENHLVLKSMLDYVKDWTQAPFCNVALDDSKEVHIILKNSNMSIVEDIHLGKNFPFEAPVLTESKHGETRTIRGEWNFHGDIYKSFTDYINFLFKHT